MIIRLAHDCMKFYMMVPSTKGNIFSLGIPSTNWDTCIVRMSLGRNVKTKILSTILLDEDHSHRLAYSIKHILSIITKALQNILALE